MGLITLKDTKKVFQGGCSRLQPQSKNQEEVELEERAHDGAKETVHGGSDSSTPLSKEHREVKLEDPAHAWHLDPPPGSPDAYCRNPEYVQRVQKHIAKYAVPHHGWAFYHIFTTLVALFAWYCLSEQWRWYTIPLRGLVGVRAFILLHDMGHKSFFRNIKVVNKTVDLNAIIGTLFSAVNVTSYQHWITGHKHHHSHSNNMDRKQLSQSAPWQAGFLNKSSLSKRLMYAFVYGPLTVWTTTPFLMFGVVLRLKATLLEFAYHVTVHYMLYRYFGAAILAQEMVALAIASSIGFYLFSIQHTFPKVYRRRQKAWDYFTNGILGSSFLQVPWILRWVTFGIEYHHIHHINARVPAYHIADCHDSGEKQDLFKLVHRFGVLESLKFCQFNVYNEVTEAFENAYNYIPLLGA
jgi:acyl-lipid omega-6 desaturase (Delta-12 desaturase)